MNERTIHAGCVTKEHLLKRGFEIYDTIDTGEALLPQYRNGLCSIDGGYWNYHVNDLMGNTLFDGWWNSNEEFDETMLELGLINTT